jgi:hypothetical protein
MKKVRAKTYPAGTGLPAFKNNFSLSSSDIKLLYLGWVIGLFCAPKGDNTNFVSMWASISLFTL